MNFEISSLNAFTSLLKKCLVRKVSGTVFLQMIIAQVSLAETKELFFKMFELFEGNILSILLLLSVKRLI